MSWSPEHPGEILLATLTGQAATGLGGGFGARQIPLSQDPYGIHVPVDFVSAYKGVRVRLEFIGNASALGCGWFSYAYLWDRAGYLAGNLNSPYTSAPDTTFSGVVDFWFTATKFDASPEAFAMWNGGGTWDIGAFGSGILNNSSLNHPVSKDLLSSSYLQVCMGQSGTEEYAVQPTAVYISSFPTSDTPVIPSPPTIYPASGAYQGVQYAGIVSADGFVRYTLDSAEPNGSSAIFTRGLRISDGMTIKAVTDLNGTLSASATATYSITGDKLAPIPSYQDAVLPLLLEQYKGDNP